MEEGLIKKLMASIQCGSCKQHYEPHNIEVLGNSENMWFLRVVCSSCHAHCLVAAIIKEDSASEVVSDLSEAEQGRFTAVEAVGADDLLDMHQFLDDFDGDFCRILGQE